MTRPTVAYIVVGMLLDVAFEINGYNLVSISVVLNFISINDVDYVKTYFEQLYNKSWGLRLTAWPMQEQI